MSHLDFNKYCMYLRKSRADIEAEARGEGETLARHEKILLELAKKINLNITEIYREIVSGETISSRPVMQQLLSEVEQGIWSGVLVVEVERLARGDTKDQGVVAQTFKFSDTKIITPMKVYDPQNEFDEEYFEFGLFMSRREYKTTTRRLQGGRVASVKEGKYVGNIPPFGYIRKKLKNEKGYTLEPHPEQAEVVKMIFYLYVFGEKQKDGTCKRLGTSLIARKLNDLKIPTAKGGAWVVSTIRGILSNPVYIGKIRWNSRPEIKKIVNGQVIKERPRAKKEDWTLVNGLHEGIIDDDIFNLAQKYLAKNPSTPIPNRYVIKNPLAGLIVCGKCGRKMSRRPYGGKFPETLMCPVTSCNNISSHLVLVETKLLHALKKWLKDYKLEFKEDEEKGNDLEINLLKKSIENTNKEIVTLEKQLSSLHDLLEQEVYTTEKFLERSRIITEKINTANKNKNELEKKLKQSSFREESKKNIIPRVEKVLEAYPHLEDPRTKNDLLKGVLERAIYIKTVDGRSSGKPDDFELVLYPRLPQ